MTVSQLEGYAAGVLGHTSYRVEGNTVYLNTDKDARKMCLALIKQRYSFAFDYDGPVLAVTII